MSERIECCDNCRFYYTESQGDGTCRRYAPKPKRVKNSELFVASNGALQSKEDFQAVWAFVEKDDWCGEFNGI